MPLDSNSRFIAGVCGVAVLALVAWLHLKGGDLGPRPARCEPAMPPEQVRDCRDCHQQDRAALPIADDTPQPPARIAGSALRL